MRLVERINVTRGWWKIYKKRHYIFLALCCFLMVSICGCSRDVTIPVYDEEPDPVDEIAAFVIVSNIDEVNEKITVHAVNYSQEIILQYNGGSDVRDKYGDILSMTNVEPGTIADIVYDGNRDKLLSLYVSGNEKVTKFENVSGSEIDILENVIRFNGLKYRMSDGVLAFLDRKEISLNEICSEDQLSIWLYNDMVCSIYVELGHGYLRLADYAGYIGGMIEVGYDVIVPVTEDMLLTVREGEYTLRIVKGDDVGTKNVKVIRNQEQLLSLADIAIEPKQIGSVKFELNPSNAIVYIDGKKVNTEGAVQLVYGKHHILIRAEGYEDYNADFNVNYAYKVKEYTLIATDATTEKDSHTSNVMTETSTNQSTTQSTTTQSEEEDTPTAKEETTQDIEKKDNVETSNNIIISAPSGASVYFDGEYVGIAPISFKKVTGSHILTFSQTGYLSKSYTVTLTDDGKDTTLKYDALTSMASLIE